MDLLQWTDHATRRVFQRYGYNEHADLREIAFMASNPKHHYALQLDEADVDSRRVYYSNPPRVMDLVVNRRSGIIVTVKYPPYLLHLARTRKLLNGRGDVRIRHIPSLTKHYLKGLQSI